MATLTELLAAQNITSALIVDDAYDAVPLASDVAEESWEDLIDDLRAHAAALEEAFPGYSAIPADELRNSDEFVAILWAMRGQIPGVLDPFFRQYDTDQAVSLADLERLEHELTALGIAPISSGRAVPFQHRDASLVFADLFLSTAQDDASIERAVQWLKALIAGREASPPLVVLMSRSTRLMEKKELFRDKAGLLGAMFRVAQKHQLVDAAFLAQTIDRLVRHRVDSLRLAKFLYAWERALGSAKERFVSRVRRIDLADYSQVRQLLLDHEGQPLGSYLLDIFDRVIQHEIEADQETISAAEELSAIDLAAYPPAHLLASTELQDLMIGVIYQHPRRLAVTNVSCDLHVSFGDLLVRSDLLNVQGEPKSVVDQAAMTPQAMAAECLDDKGREGGDADGIDPLNADIFAVMTPACDLLREGAKNVLLVQGTLRELTPEAWSYTETVFRTPILDLVGQRYWIQWDLKSIQTVGKERLSRVTGPDGLYKLSARLRESHALELQQALLADLGRVGVIAKMPAGFPVSVQAFYPTEDDRLEPIAVAALAAESAVYFVGRNANGDPECRLVLTEQGRDALLVAVQGLDAAQVGRHARPSFARAIASKSLPELLERGLVAPPPQDGKARAIRASDAAGTFDLGKMFRNKDIADIAVNSVRRDALIVLINDVDAAAAERLFGTSSV